MVAFKARRLDKIVQEKRLEDTQRLSFQDMQTRSVREETRGPVE